MPSFNDWLFGKKDRVKKRSVLSDEQEQLQQLIMQGLESGEGPFADIFGGFNQAEFEKGVTQPALQNFKENILPMINEKFIGANQVGGSGMQKAQMKGATDLQSALARLMYDAQQQQKQQRAQGVSGLYNRQAIENEYQKGHPGALAEFGTELFKAAGKRIGSLGSNSGGNTPAVDPSIAVAG